MIVYYSIRHQNESKGFDHIVPYSENIISENNIPIYYSQEQLFYKASINEILQNNLLALQVVAQQ